MHLAAEYSRRLERCQSNKDSTKSMEKLSSAPGALASLKCAKGENGLRLNGGTFPPKRSR